jgi:hypothetical protein
MADGVAQVIQCLLSKHEALNSNPNTAQGRKKKKWEHPTLLSLLSEALQRSF